MMAKLGLPKYFSKMSKDLKLIFGGEGSTVGGLKIVTH